MTITVTWDNDDRTVVYIRAEGAWTWDEFHAGLAEANVLIRSVEHSVDIISHLVDAEAQKLPPGAFAQWRRAMSNHPHNAGLIIIVPGSPMVQVFTSTFLNMLGSWYPLKFASTPTVGEARALAARLRDQRKPKEEN